MSLLSKKSWHVRNRKNIERVKNDEAKAEALLRVEQDRKLKAEQEFRIQQLKLRTGQAVKETEKHINLFEGSEDKLSKSEAIQSNIETRRDNWNRHLVRPDANKPWYCSGNSASLIGSSPTKLTIRINDPLDRINLKNSLLSHSQTRRSTDQPEPSTSQASAAHRPRSSAPMQSDSSPEIIDIIEPTKKVSPAKDLDKKRDRGSRERKIAKSKHKKHGHKSHHHKHKHRKQIE